MTTRGAVLLGIGMLVLGLLLGLATGGVAGFFMGRTNRLAVERNPFPFQGGPFTQQPNQQQTNPRNRGNLPLPQNLIAGVRVLSVEENTPAAAAGLQPGDIITAIDSTKIDETHSLGDLIQAHKPGDKVALTVIRGNKNMTINVELGKAPQDGTSAYLGIRFSPAFGGQRRFQNPSAIPNG